VPHSEHTRPNDIDAARGCSETATYRARPPVRSHYTWPKRQITHFIYGPYSATTGPDSVDTRKLRPSSAGSDPVSTEALPYGLNNAPPATVFSPVSLLCFVSLSSDNSRQTVNALWASEYAINLNYLAHSLRISFHSFLYQHFVSLFFSVTILLNTICIGLHNHALLQQSLQTSSFLGYFWLFYSPKI